MTEPTLALARRPKKGSLGERLEVIVNTFEVRDFPSQVFYHYDVSFDPEIKGARRKSDIMQRLQLHTAPQDFQRPAAFDGARNLFSYQFPLFNAGAKTYTVNMSDRPPSGPIPRGVITVTLTHVGSVSPHDLTAVLAGQTSGVPITTTPLQVFNVLVQQAAELKFPSHKKNKFFIEDGRELAAGLEIWRGFFQSIRPSIGKLIMNVDMATGVMYQRGPLHDFIMAFFSLGDDVRKLFQLSESHPYWSKVKSILKGLTIVQKHSGRIRTIKSLVPNAGDFEFTRKDGQPIKVVDYFKANHNVRLTYPKMPGILTRRDEVIPFELCLIKEGQHFKKKTSGDVMSKMLNFSKKRPQERLSIIRTGIDVMQLNNSPFVRQAGFSVDPNPMSITGRVLEPPSMIYGRTAAAQKPSSGAWNMLRKQLMDPQPIPLWAVIDFANLRLDSVQGFILALMEAMGQVGIRVEDTRPLIVQGNPARVSEELGKLCGSVVSNNQNRPPTIIIVILPPNSPDIRKAIKQYGDILSGIPTQCVRSDKLLRANNQYHNNLILKINAKLGGANTVPTGQHFDWFKRGSCMVIGADVTHPGPGTLRPSVAAVVSSIDEHGVKYVAKCSVQHPRLEIIENLKSLVVHALEMFSKYRSFISKLNPQAQIPTLPEQIIFYRDGVSEGEIQQVVESEINQILEAVNEVYTKFRAKMKAKLTFIVVGKRHHIRFIPKQAQSADKSGNCPAGFVVDEAICAPGVFDFYMLSHAGLLGTSRPSHYIVVKDDNEFDSNTLQSFSFALCHVYARATRSVSIPAPCYYADIACARADYHFNPKLNFTDDLSSDGGEFDMKKWFEGFANVHSRQQTNMYFM